MLNRIVFAAAFTLATAGGAAAQTPAGDPSPSQQPPASSASTSGGSAAQTPSTPPPATTVETRPATTTFRGDTGLWMVPTGEILPDRKFSISAYRVNFDDNQGFTDISDW